jgi:GNAT superfamily N-acetyltransferase
MTFEFKYKEYAKALYYALQEDAFYITMEKSVNNGNSPKEAMFRYMEYSMIEGAAYGELIFPENHEHGVSIWSKPLRDEAEKEKSEKKKNFLANQMGAESLQIYNTMVSFMSERSEKIIAEDSWYLSILGILPQFQGKGLGPELITTVLDKTDRLNVATYLETFTPRNMTFYYRLGYREKARIHEPTAGADYWIMVREPFKKP